MPIGMWTALLVGLAGAAAPAGSPPAPPLPAPAALPARVFTLDNGVTVAVHRDPRAPLVATWVQVAAGAGDERPPGSGLAHLVEHLMYTGSPGAPDGGYDLLLAEVGAENNAWTDHDSTAYFSLAPAGAVERVLALEADRLVGLVAALDDDALGTQLSVVSAEAALARGAPHGQDLAAALRAVFGADHAYGVPVLGDDERRATLELDDVVAWLDRAHVGARVTVVMAGDLDVDAAAALARRRLAGLPVGEAAPPPPAVPLPPPGSWRFEAPADRPTVLLAWPTPPRGHPDAPALDLLAAALAGDRSGPLAAAFEATPDLAPPRAWTWWGEQAGLFVTQLGGPAPLEALDRRLRAALGPALDAASTDPRALDRARRRLLADHVRGLESLLRRAELLADCVQRTGAAGCDAARMSALAAVTPADLARARARWLAPAQARAVWVLPGGSLDPTADRLPALVLP